MEAPKAGEEGSAACIDVSEAHVSQLAQGKSVMDEGDASTAVGGKNHYKEGKGIPSPLLIRRFVGHSGWEEQCGHILGLIKMDWNTDGLYHRRQ